jgi:hypothetical protein
VLPLQRGYDMLCAVLCRLKSQKFFLFFFLAAFSATKPLSASCNGGISGIALYLLEECIQMAKFDTLLKLDLPAINGPDSTGLEPYLGLAEGQQDEEKNGPVHHLQQVLLDWNKNLPHKVTGLYDQATCKSITLFKLVHDCGHDGTRIDKETAQHLLRQEYGWPEQKQEASLVAQVLNEAVKFLGLRYRLGGSGVKYIDCGMFTRMSMVRAGIVEKLFNRTAAAQYKYAEQGDMGLYLRKAGETPQPGDLVFFNWRTRFQKRRYKGITHVGFYLGQIGDRLLVLEAASRGERRVTIKDRSDSISRIAGYAQIVGAPASFDVFNFINMAAEDLEKLMIPKLGSE